MTRVGIITQARMTSTRLPGKVLLEAGGRSMLAHHLDRLTQTGLPVYVATTTNADDLPIVELAASYGTGTYRGSEHDVLSRFAEAAELFELDTVVRVTSDCPLIDPALIGRGVDRFAEIDDAFAHVSNVLDRSYPRGFDFEVFSGEALREANLHSADAYEREHVTPYLYDNRSGRASLWAIRRETDASRLRVTLDTPEDFSLLRALIESHAATELDVEQIIHLLEAHPELVALNASVEQKKRIG